MPIPVVCPGCKASFNVSEKFAGKQGPCPKCKTVIAIPKPDPAKKPVEEVKIGEPEPPAGGKSKTGRPTTKPLLRTDLKLSPVAIGAIVGVILALFVAAYFARGFVMSPYPLTGEQQLLPELKAPYDSQILRGYVLRGVGLLFVALPIVWAGYQVLRDDELEPYRGRSLYMRIGVCMFVYLLLWGVYAVIPSDYTSAWYMWLVMAPPLLAVGFTAAYFCFDFDPTSALTHFLSFAVVTLLLGMTAGLTMPWYEEPSTLPPANVGDGGQLPIFDSFGNPINDAAKALHAEKLKQEAKAKAKPSATAAGS